MDRWTLAFFLGAPLGIVQTLVFGGAGGFGRMLGEMVAAIAFYMLIWYGVLVVCGRVRGAVRGGGDPAGEKGG